MVGEDEGTGAAQLPRSNTYTYNCADESETGLNCPCSWNKNGSDGQCFHTYFI
jgi:hypothetical protein